MTYLVSPENRRLLAQNADNIYLKADFETLYQRIQQDAEQESRSEVGKQFGHAPLPGSESGSVTLLLPPRPGEGGAFSGEPNP